MDKSQKDSHIPEIERKTLTCKKFLWRQYIWGKNFSNKLIHR